MRSLKYDLDPTFFIAKRLVLQSIRVGPKFAAIQTASQLEMFKHKYPTGGGREAVIQNRNRAVATQIQTPPNHNKVPSEKTTRSRLCHNLELGQFS